jgi:predicted ArsR family transcriptional regulator
MVDDVETDETAMSAPCADASIRAVAALEDQSRRGMYAFIRQAQRPVSRDEAANVVGISRKLAAFHLDKLVEAGVLCARYEALSGIRKVGRAPKVYEPSGLDIRVNIPQRQHDVLAGILLDAVAADDPGEPARLAAVRIAERHGRALGVLERERCRPGRLGAERALGLAAQVLAGHGFEPVRDGQTRVRLRDCPFYPLTAQAPGLVCEINRAFCAGVLAGLAAPSVEAVLEPRPGACCVELRRTERTRISADSPR